MLIDIRLCYFKLKEKFYKVNDCDGLYVVVILVGMILFCYNYLINGRQEIVIFGYYGVGGIMFVEVCEWFNEVKKMVVGGGLFEILM